MGPVGVDSKRSILFCVKREDRKRGGSVGIYEAVLERIVNGRMIVDIEHRCILNGLILFQLFQGQKVMPADFLLAVKAFFLTAGPGQWNLLTSGFISSTPKKPTGVKPITFSAHSSLSVANCAVFIQIQGAISPLPPPEIFPENDL